MSVVAAQLEEVIYTRKHLCHLSYGVMGLQQARGQITVLKINLFQRISLCVSLKARVLLP